MGRESSPMLGTHCETASLWRQMRKIKSEQGRWPPSSPAELREWCDAVQPPMDALAAAFYRSSLETGVLDAKFCRRQLEKYEVARAEGRNAYAGWD